MVVCRTCGQECVLTPRQLETHDRQCRACRAAAWRAANKRGAYQDVRHHGEKARGVRTRLMAEQGGRCAICRVAGVEMARGLALDHDHETGELRGLLCHKCNLAIGLLGDDPARAEAVAAYLRQYQFKPLTK